MQTDNLELKKLVYLYLMNYAKSQPDMAIMAVNTFVKVRKPSFWQLFYVDKSVFAKLRSPMSSFCLFFFATYARVKPLWTES